jgi:hypothetical protein
MTPEEPIYSRRRKMDRSTGVTYTRYRCCIDKWCSKFESPWQGGECYDEGGRIVRDCSKCGDTSEDDR